MADVDSHWSDGSGVTYSETERVCVLAMKANGAEHVAAVIKRHSAQALFEGHGNSEFRVDDQKLIAPNRDRDGEASRGAAG